MNMIGIISTYFYDWDWNIIFMLCPSLTNQWQFVKNFASFRKIYDFSQNFIGLVVHRIIVNVAIWNGYLYSKLVSICIILLLNLYSLQFDLKWNRPWINYKMTTKSLEGYLRVAVWFTQQLTATKRQMTL